MANGSLDLRQSYFSTSPFTPNVFPASWKTNKMYYKVLDRLRLLFLYLRVRF